LVARAATIGRTGWFTTFGLTTICATCVLSDEQLEIKPIIAINGKMKA